MKENQSAQYAIFEQALINRLQTLPTPIRICRHEHDGGYWYQWATMVAGIGDCGTFADALIEALTYMQRHSVQEQHPVRQLLGAGCRDTRKDILSLRAALRYLHLHQRRVKATEAMFLLMGGQAGQEWITGELALEIVLNARHSGSVFADWDSYLETGLGPDPQGIYVFLGNQAYRAFDLEPEPTTANSMQAQMALHLWMLVRRDFAPDASDMETRHRSTIALLEQREDVDQSALLALMSECLEIYEDNPRSESRAF